jgi:hypothetical protein
MNIAQYLPFNSWNKSIDTQVYVTAQAATRINPKSSGKLLVCQGAVWVTRKDDLVDYFLNEGQTMQFRAGDFLVLENQSSATRASRVCFYENTN